MSYVVDISATAEEDLDRFLQAYNSVEAEDETAAEIEQLFDAISDLGDRLARDPSSVRVRRELEAESSFPYAMGWHQQHMFWFVFRFRADDRTENRIEILRFGHWDLYRD